MDIVLLRMLKAKLHGAIVTQANIEYEGSITIDRDLMDAVGLIEYEAVLVADKTNGTRLETYVIEGPRGSGVIGMNGAAARLVHERDEILIMCFAQMSEEEAQRHHPKIAIIGDNNTIARMK